VTRRPHVRPVDLREPRRVVASGSHDIGARWGGDEFAVLLPGTGATRAHSTIDRIARQLSDQHLTISAGIADLPPWSSPEGLLHDADTALYRAKQDGKNCVRAYEPSPDHSSRLT
jgi:diguanylate cyclase (GGDEF)-like protein